MNVQFIDKSNITATEVPELMKGQGIEYYPISCNNWPNAFPYSPQSEFAIAYTEEAMLLHFKSEEQDLRSFIKEDNGDVWTDACVEIFFAPDGDDHYYNLECNCIGKLLLGFGTGRHDRQRASGELLRKIQRWTSSGAIRDDVATPWQLALVVPFSVFYAHHIRSPKDLRSKVNFYKCGGSGKYEHYLSFVPIKTPSPDFHRPEFFTELNFNS